MNIPAEKETEKFGNLPGPGPGRPPGVPNRMTAALREMVLTALDEAGGAEYLAKQAIENPPAFLALVGKLLPRTGTLEIESRMTLEQLVAASYPEAAR